MKTLLRSALVLFMLLGSYAAVSAHTTVAMHVPGVPSCLCSGN